MKSYLKKQKLFKKLLLATSTISALASVESAWALIPLNQIAKTNLAANWVGGAAPVNNDSLRMTQNLFSLSLAKELNIFGTPDGYMRMDLAPQVSFDEINTYGNGGTITVNSTAKIKSIVNSTDPAAQGQVQADNGGIAILPGAGKQDVTLTFHNIARQQHLLGANPAPKFTLTITDSMEGIKKVVMPTQSFLIFDNPNDFDVNATIKPKDAAIVGSVTATGRGKLNFNEGIGAIFQLNIKNDAIVNIYKDFEPSTTSFYSKNSTLILNPSKTANMQVMSTLQSAAIDAKGIPITADLHGILKINKGYGHQVKFIKDTAVATYSIGETNFRLKEIDIEDDNNIIFEPELNVKNIKIGKSTVKFLSDVSMVTKAIVTKNKFGIVTQWGAITDDGNILFTSKGPVNSGKVIFADNINFDGSIKTKFNNSGTVEYEGRSKVDYQIGTAVNRLHSVYAGKGAVDFNQAVYTKELILNGNSPVTYNHKTLKTDKVLLQHANAHIHFTKGLTQAVKIEAQNNNWGKVEFTGGGEVGEIGAAAHAVNELIFNAGGYNLNSNITTNGLTLNGNPTFTVRAPIVVKDAGKTYKLAANAVAATVNNLPLVGGGTVGAPLILATPLQNQLFTDIGGRLLAPGGAGGDAAGIKAIAATLAGYNALDYDAAILLARPAAGAAALVGNVAQLNAQITHIALHNRAVNLYNARTNAEVLRAAYNAGHGNAHHGGVAVAGAPGYNSAVRTAARNATVAAIGGINKARIKALSRLDAAAVARLSEAEVREYNTVMAEYNRQLPIALAAAGHRPAPHVPAPGNPAPGNPAPAPQEPAARTVTSAVIDNAGRLAMVSVAAPTAVHAAAIESTSRSTVAIVNSDNKTGVREEFAFAAAKKTGLSEEKIKKVVDRTPEQIAALSKEEVKEHKEVAEAISASGTLEAIIKKAEKEAVKTEVRTEAWKELGVDRKDVADAAPAQHVQFVAKLEQAPKMEGKVASIAQDAIADPTKVENLEKAALSLKKITRSESLDKLSEAAKDDAAVASASNAVKSLLYSASMSKNYSSSEERKAAIDKTVAQATETAASVSSHVSSAVSNIVSRIDALSFSNVAQLADSGLGASAGDDSVFAKAGVWVSGIYGQSKQGSVNSKSGYKGNLYGGSAGADLELGESIVLGGAYSNVSSDFKYSGGNKIGDKTDVKSHVFSIYAQTSFSQDIAWNNIVSLSRSNVEGKRNAEGKSVASGKSKSEGLSFETNLGYKIVQDDIMLVPSIGLRYGYFKDKGYTETGAGVHNITQSASSSKILTGILGAKVMWNTKVGDASFSPYLQGSIDHNFSHKGGNVNAKYTWMENYFASKAETENKPEKTAYNVGVGALMKQNNVELTLGYNLNLAKKYQSHQGTVKLKVSF